MTAAVHRNRPLLPDTVVFATLPGPSRKRLQSPYCYRLTYRAEDIHTPGCVLMWDVLGGREIYQIALERLASGGLHWHCTCADAIFRGKGRHLCKHIRGLILQGRDQAAVKAPPQQERADPMVPSEE
ncbi:MAG: hypothetical protein SNJ75_08705 [Gemmataceae bacterium]